MSSGLVNERLCDMVLRDGSTLALRRARGDDLDAVAMFFAGLSVQSRHDRFLGTPHLDQAAVAQLLPLTSTDGEALVGECLGRIVAFAAYQVAAGHPDRAEVSFAIADAFQGRGIGMRLLEQLAGLASARGVRTFDADVLVGNQRMMDVFLDSGYAVSRRLDGGVVHVELDLFESGACAVDARVRVERRAPRPAGRRVHY